VAAGRNNKPDVQLRGFYHLYQIDVGRKNNEAASGESGRESKQRGLKSLYGQRGSILAHFHWTWDYLLWGIRWNIVQRMLIDGPCYETETEKETEKAERLTKENAANIANYINTISI